jgi:aspartyl-tRNA(Asn)/glutamyl-tRNA(Gln) amidotransferase subunit B
MNSFKNVRDAVEHEIRRQVGLVERGDRVVQETRLWDAARSISQSMRSKEHAHDYRYFPEPDLPPLVIDDSMLAQARASLPELPEARLGRYEAQGMSAQDAGVLVAEHEIADYYDAVAGAVGSGGAVLKRAANWVINEVLARVGDARKLAAPDLPVPPAALAELVVLVEKGTLSGKQAKEVFGRMWQERRRAGDIVETESVAQVSDAVVLEETCRKVVAAHPEEAARFRAGRTQLLGFFVGAVMKETGGKANPKTVNELLRRLLAE